MQKGIYLGHMSFARFSMMAQAFGAPILERTELNRPVRFVHIQDPGNPVYYKCDNEFMWMYIPEPLSQVAGRCGKRHEART